MTASNHLGKSLDVMRSVHVVLLMMLTHDKASHVGGRRLNCIRNRRVRYTRYTRYTVA